MANSSVTAEPFISEPLTWSEICARYPDEWVALVEIDWINDIDELGYSPRQGEEIATVRTAIGKEHGCLLRVSRFSALGFSGSDVRVHVFDLPEGFGIDGLLGLSFLRQFHIGLRLAEGRLLAERVAAA